MPSDLHHDLILDQFTRQATPFSTASTITDAGALAMIVDAARPARADAVLDLACGGGIVVCAFAPHVRHATGIDLTPAMLDQATALAKQKNATNVTFQLGDATALPFDDASFDIVVTRFSVHHFPHPLAALREMRRVCAPRGRVIVVDMYASEQPEQAAEWNRLERLRDPSHSRCLSLTELKALFTAVELPPPGVTFYRLSDAVQNLLARSFPNPGDEQKITAMFAAEPATNRMGIWVRSDPDGLRYAYPVAILCSARSAG
ncbi:MAG: class I SAM-dependent methyltransferase [Acetobacteraceae bacterium]